MYSWYTATRLLPQLLSCLRLSLLFLLITTTRYDGSSGALPELISFVRDAGELAGVSLQALGSQFGDSTAQWLYRLARGCDTEEVFTSLSRPHFQFHHC